MNNITEELLWAAQNGHLEVVKYLLSKGSKLTISQINFWSKPDTEIRTLLLNNKRRIKMLNKYLEQTNNEEIKSWISGVLKNYLKTNTENVGEVEHIIDYFHVRKKACDRRKKSFNLTKMDYLTAARLSKEWVKTLNKKARDIVETESDLEEILNFGNGIRLVKLCGKNAYLREGKLMSHCVGSYLDKADSEIYSLRDAKNNPHCTLEITKSNDQVNQIKGKGNGSIHPKYISYILKSLKHFKKDIRKSELTYLGYKELSKEVFHLYNTNFKDFKYMSYKDSLFMYVNQRFVRK